MPTESIRVSARFPVKPDRLYIAWLDSQEHTRFTGDTARVEAAVGGRFSAWSGYITGETLELDPPGRIVQSWRTTEFPQGAEDSRIEVRFEPEGEGTRLTIEHSGIPEGQGDQCEDGWIDYYFEPMQRYFRRIAEMLAAPDEPARGGTGTAAMKAIAGTAAKKAAAAPVGRMARAAKEPAAKRAVTKTTSGKRAVTKKTAGTRGAKTRAASRAPKRVTARKATKKAAKKAAGRPAKKTARQGARKAAPRRAKKAPVRPAGRKAATRNARKGGRKSAARTRRSGGKAARSSAGRKRASRTGRRR